VYGDGKDRVDGEMVRDSKVVRADGGNQLRGMPSDKEIKGMGRRMSGKVNMLLQGESFEKIKKRSIRGVVDVKIKITSDNEFRW
jgi:hypothetical protein